MRRFVSFLIILLLLYVPVAAEEVSEGKGTKKIDKDYIKKNYPEVYQEIYREGKEAGIKEAEAKERVAKQEPDDQKKAEGMEQSRASLGDWWNHSSLDKPMPDKFLWHGELSYTGILLRGNEDGFVHKGNAKLFLRRDRFTNTLQYDISRQKIKQSGGGFTDKEYQMAEEALQYDLTKKLFAEGGIIWETDKVTLIGDRYLYFAGLGYYVLHSDRHKLKVSAAYGQQHERYKHIIEELINIKTSDTGIGYFYQTFDWLITKKISFMEGFRIIWDFKKSGQYEQLPGNGYVKVSDTNRFRLTFSTELEYKLTDYFSLLLANEIKYDRNPWPGVKKTDSKQTLGVKFNY